MGVVTDLLELLGFVLVVTAVAVLIAEWSVPGALAAAGVGLVAVSWLIVAVDGRKRTKK